jgi:hypothetical protein
MRTEAQREAARRAVVRANLRLAKELLDALKRNQSDRWTLRRRVRALLRRVEREGV